MKAAKTVRVWSWEIEDLSGVWHIEEEGDDFRLDGTGIAEGVSIPGPVALAIAKLIIKKAEQ